MNKQIPIHLIVAMDNACGIGKNNQLPWYVKEELQYFKKITTGSGVDKHRVNAIVMGRKTWESLPFKPLKDRLNIVLSSQKLSLPSPVGLIHDIEMLSNDLNQQFKDQLDAMSTSSAQIEQVFIIGGASVYKQALKTLPVSRLYVTHVDGTFACDTFFQPIPEQFKLLSETKKTFDKLDVRFSVYESQLD